MAACFTPKGRRANPCAERGWPGPGGGQRPAQPTFLLCDQRGLWISEDSTHRARLLRIDAQGQRHTVLTFLKAPQAIVPDGKGGYLLAEGGRDRVLRLTPPIDTNTAQAQDVAPDVPGA